MKTEKTVITIETWQRTLIRLNRRDVFVWCEQSAAETPMLLPEEAARRGRISTRDVYRQIELGTLHFTETESGLLFVCRNSFSNIEKKHSKNKVR